MWEEHYWRLLVTSPPGEHGLLLKSQCGIKQPEMFRDRKSLRPSLEAIQTMHASGSLAESSWVYSGLTHRHASSADHLGREAGEGMLWPIVLGSIEVSVLLCAQHRLYGKLKWGKVQLHFSSDHLLTLHFSGSWVLNHINHFTQWAGFVFIIPRPSAQDSLLEQGPSEILSLDPPKFYFTSRCFVFIVFRETIHFGFKDV